ncbi:Zinc transporter 1 [Spatholobus suberectus]|nr:Zinc transporter 1 [Spatholobus suberectus]
MASSVAAFKMKTLKSTFLVVCLLASLLYPIKAHGGGSSSNESDRKDLHSRGLILVKIWCLIIMLVSTFAGGVSPYFFRWNEAFLLLGTQFAGGVFLGTALMHFLGDSAATFGDLTTNLTLLPLCWLHPDTFSPCLVTAL